jgi:hypothetical protein
MPSTDLCYTGSGAKKSGNHAQQEFLDIMNKHYAIECPRYIKGLKCKVCKELTNLGTKNVQKQIKAHKEKRTYKISKKNEAAIIKLRSKCDKCKNKNTRKCSLKEYIDFSGALPGKCPLNETPSLTTRRKRHAM